MNTLSYVVWENLDYLNQISKQRCFEKLCSKRENKSVFSGIYHQHIITLWIRDGEKGFIFISGLMCLLVLCYTNTVVCDALNEI